MKAHEKYYLKACKALGKTPVPVLEDRSDIDRVSSDAYDRLVVCIWYKNLINGKRWIPIYNGTETHYFVRAWPNASGSEFSCALYDYWHTITNVGARLEYRTYELCEEGRILLMPYYVDYMLIPNEEK